MSVPATTRVDLHCHSTAPERAKLGVAQSLGLPERATPPADQVAGTPVPDTSPEWHPGSSKQAA